MLNKLVFMSKDEQDTAIRFSCHDSEFSSDSSIYWIATIPLKKLKWGKMCNFQLDMSRLFCSCFPQKISVLLERCKKAALTLIKVSRFL